MYSAIRARNNSIFAHGLTFVSPDNYNTFLDIAERFIAKHCELYVMNYSERLESVEFVKIAAND
jgi:hypothetical protein